MEEHHGSQLASSTSASASTNTNAYAHTPPAGTGTSMTHRPSSPSPAEAGPSRIRRTPTTPTQASAQGQSEYPQRPASPANTLPQTETASVTDRPTGSGDVGDEGDEQATAAAAVGGAGHTDTGHPPRPSTPYLDLATYPTQTLLRLLASLLQQIASANDQLRPEMQEEGMDEDSSGGGGGPGGGGEDGQSSTTSGTRSRADSRASNTAAPATGLHPSPTTALFSTQSQSQSQSQSSQPPPSAQAAPPPPPPQPPVSRLQQRKTSLSPTTGRAETLFTASKTSLSHHSSLLSFHARHIPSISIEAYLLRILKYCPTTNEVFLGLLVYFDRMSRLGTAGGLGGMMKGGKGFAIDSYNVHRLVIAGVTVASKFFSDVFYTNSRYAKVGGLPPHELNQLELQFLLLNDFRLVIPADEMQRYGNRLLGYWENRENDAEAAAAAESEAGGEGGGGGGTESGRKESARHGHDHGHGPNANGVGAPTEDQVKGASDMVRAESDHAASVPGKPSTSTSPTTPTDQAAQHRTSNHNRDTSVGGDGERPSSPRQTTNPTRVEGGGGFQTASRPVSSNRRNSFDGPSNGTGSITNAIPTA